jgi:hypothetical protein
MNKWILSVLFLSCSLVAKEIKIELELLPLDKQSKVKAQRLRGYYSDLEIVQGRLKKCETHKNFECVENYKQLIQNIEHELENAKQRLADSDDWRYGLSIKNLINSIPLLEQYDYKRSCKLLESIDAFYFAKINENNDVVNGLKIQCRSKERIAYCDVWEVHGKLIYDELIDAVYEAPAEFNNEYLKTIVRLWNNSNQKSAFVKDSDYLQGIEIANEEIIFILSNSACEAPSRWMRYSIDNFLNSTPRIIYISEGTYTK